MLLFKHYLSSPLESDIEVGVALPAETAKVQER